MLQRSEGFRKTHDEKQAAMIGSGDVGAQGYHPKHKPTAQLLEELKSKDIQRASVWEVRFFAYHWGSGHICTPACQQAPRSTGTHIFDLWRRKLCKTHKLENDMQVAVMTTLMGSASGLGAVPFFFVGSLSAEWAALANALACGVMLAASFDLVHEGQPYGAGLTILGVILGGCLGVRV